MPRLEFDAVEEHDCRRKTRNRIEIGVVRVSIGGCDAEPRD